MKIIETPLSVLAFAEALSDGTVEADENTIEAHVSYEDNRDLSRLLDDPSQALRLVLTEPAIEQLTDGDEPDVWVVENGVLGVRFELI